MYVLALKSVDAFAKASNHLLNVLMIARGIVLHMQLHPNPILFCIALDAESERETQISVHDRFMALICFRRLRP